MPAYNFQKQFVPYILSWRKPHTIRRRRKHVTKVGDWLYLYTGMRTKQCEWICSTRCVRIDPIIILPFEKNLISGFHIDIKEFVFNDGFEDVDTFYKFFERYKQDRLDDFEIISWEPERMYPTGNYQTFLERQDEPH